MLMQVSGPEPGSSIAPKYWTQNQTQRCLRTRIFKRLIRSGQGEIVRAVGNQLVTKCFLNFAPVDQKRAGHPFDVAGGKTDEVAAKPRIEHSENALGIQILSKFRAKQPECLVEVPFRVAQARDVEQAVRLEEPLCLFFGSQVDKSERRTFCLDGLTLLREVRHGFAAKRAAEVAQENKKQRPFGKRGERLTGLRGVSAEERRVDSVRTKHAGSNDRHPCGSYRRVWHGRPRFRRLPADQRSGAGPGE